MKFSDSGQDGLAAALQTVSTSSTGVGRCKQAAMAEIKSGNFKKVLQIFDAKTREIADPNDFKYGMGQKRLAYLFVLDAVCIGNMHSQTDAQISTETRQELVDELIPQLATFVERLATPCNCERIDKLLDGWVRRDKAPFFPAEQIRDAKQRLHPSHRKRREKLATRIAATYVQTNKGKGLNSYLPLEIPCMYGSFMPKLPSDATRNPSKASLSYGVDMLKKQLGDKYAPQCAPPSSIRFLNAAVGKLESSLGDDPYTAAWMWADDEEIAHRKRLKIEPPAVHHDTRVEVAEAQTEPAPTAQDSAPKPHEKPAETSTPSKARPSSASDTKLVGDNLQGADRAETEPEACKTTYVSPQKQPPGLGTWETVGPDDDASGQDTITKSSPSASQQYKGPHGKFSGLKLTGVSPQEERYSNSASPQPVSWLQPGANQLPQHDYLPHTTPLLPPAAPQYGAPAYEVMDVYADMYGPDTYGAQQYSSYHAADDFYQPPLPSEPYAPDEAPPLPDEPPPPLPDEPPPPPASVSAFPPLPVTLHAPPPHPDEAPPPLPDEPPPPLPDEPYDVQVDTSAKPPSAAVAPLPPRSDTESGELIDSGTPTPRQRPMPGASAVQVQSKAAAASAHSLTSTHHSSMQVASNELQTSPPQPPAPLPVPSLSAPPPVAPPSSHPPPAEPIPPPTAGPADTQPSFSGDVHARHAWLTNAATNASNTASPARNEGHSSYRHAASHNHTHNPLVHQAHAMLQPPYPESPWDIANTHSASASPVPGDITHDGHAQQMIASHHNTPVSGATTPEPYPDPALTGQAQHVQQQQYMMSMPQGFHQHPQQPPTLQPPPGTAPLYPPHGSMPSWGHDPEHAHPHNSMLSHNGAPFPSPAAANSLPPSNPSSPMPGQPQHPYSGNSHQQQQPALPGPPPRLAGAAPPVAVPPGAPSTFHHMSAPAPGGADMPAWGSPMPIGGADGGYGSIGGPPAFPPNLPRPVGGMMGHAPGRQQGGHQGRRGGPHGSSHGQGYRQNMPGGGRVRKRGS